MFFISISKRPVKFILTGLIFLLYLYKLKTMEPEKDIFDQWDEEEKNSPWYRKVSNNLYRWFANEGRYLHKDFISGVKKLWYWLPIIWKDRDWDSHYIFEIMKHKLSAQADYIGNRDFHTTAKHDANKMKLCVKLMSLVQEEFYSSEYSNYHKTKHWFEDIEGRPNLSKWESRLLEENFDDYFKKYPLIYKKVLNGDGRFKLEGREDNKQIIAMNIAHINHDRARKLLFKIMEENVEKWWD